MNSLRENKRLARRYAADKRFKALGFLSILIAISFLIILLFSIFSTGYTAFFSTQIKVDLSKLQNAASPEMDLGAINFNVVLQETFDKYLPSSLSPRKKRKLIKNIFSSQADNDLKKLVEGGVELSDRNYVWLTSSTLLDQVHKGNIDVNNPAQLSSIGEYPLEIYRSLKEEGRIRSTFNTRFVSSGDSRYPELAGIAGAVIGSFYTLLVCLLISFPVAVAAAMYLEEFSSKNKLTSFIEININNLAAVPSIVYGLLGLVVILGFMGIPRSTPLAGGIVLALRTLPIIIIASRAAIRAVPPSIRQGAMAMGASPIQVVFHHVLPLSLPGTMTGAIIGLSQALGETAPLLLIGMVAFVVDLPGSPLDPSTTLPVQIYLWAEGSERGYVEKTSAAIMVILFFLITMNSIAVFMRKKYERRW